MIYLKYVSGILLSLGINLAHGQELRNDFGNEYFSPNFYTREYNAPDGSPYLSDAFLPSSINDITETQLVRFDAFAGRVEVKLSPTRVVALDSDIYYIIQLKDGSEKRFETLKYIDSKGQTKSSFFEIIHETDTYKICRRDVAKFYKAEKAQGYQESKPARFKMADPEYYFTTVPQSQELMQIPDRIKEFKQVFPNNEKAIRDLVKNEKLRLDVPEDLIRILDYYFDNS